MRTGSTNSGSDIDEDHAAKKDSLMNNAAETDTLL